MIGREKYEPAIEELSQWYEKRKHRFCSCNTVFPHDCILAKDGVACRCVCHMPARWEPRRYSLIVFKSEGGIGGTSYQVEVDCNVSGLKPIWSGPDFLEIMRLASEFIRLDSKI